MFNYPPSFEQLLLPLTASWQLWLLRFLTLVLVGLTFYFLSRRLNQKSRIYFWALFFMAPLPLLLVVYYPLSAIKLAVITLIILKTKKSLVAKVFSLSLIFLFMFVVNVKLLNQKTSFVSHLSITTAQAEVMDHFNKETLLKPGNPVPLVIKRISYNKYFFVIKKVSEDVLRFFDSETIFFQEINPLGQKAEPLFYWGEFGLFALAIWLFARGKLPSTNKEDLLLFSSIIYFLLTDDFIFIRYMFAFVLILVVLAQAMPVLIKQKRPFKIATIAFLLLTLYGAQAHAVDRHKRPAYWLDNRPLIYQQFFNTISLDSYKHIDFADVLGKGERYCRYYRRDCQKFTFFNFQMSNKAPQTDTLYLGFLGNFFGVDGRNYEDWQKSDILQKVTDKIQIITTEYFRDNPVGGYGHYVVFAVKNKLYEEK